MRPPPTAPPSQRSSNSQSRAGQGTGCVATPISVPAVPVAYTVVPGGSNSVSAASVGIGNELARTAALDVDMRAPADDASTVRYAHESAVSINLSEVVVPEVTTPRTLAASAIGYSRGRRWKSLGTITQTSVGVTTRCVVMLLARRVTVRVRLLPALMA